MKFLVVLIFSLGAFARSPIIGGTPVPAAEVPWVVKIEKDKKQHCSGSLITPKWIVSAGHCFSDTNASYTVLGGGDGKRENLVQFPAIKRIIVHPKFYMSSITPATDIALIELGKEVSQKPVAILEEEHASDEVSIYGWGDIGKNQEMPSELTGITLSLVPSADYPKLSSMLFFRRFKAWLDPSRYLITVKDDVSTCGGDSGTGWTMNVGGEPRLVAVHNAGDDCESVSVGNIIRKHMPWIKSVVKF